VLGLKCVGDVFEENQPEDDVIVLRRVQIVPQCIRGSPSLASKPRLAPVSFLAFAFAI
jgi:hypothetical protein